MFIPKASAMPWRFNSVEDEIDAGEKIHTVVVSAQLSGHAACERVLVRIELRPGVRYRFQEVGSVDAHRAAKLSVGRVLPGDAKDVVQQRSHRCPLFFIRHAKTAN